MQLTRQTRKLSPGVEGTGVVMSRPRVVGAVHGRASVLIVIGATVKAVGNNLPTGRDNPPMRCYQAGLFRPAIWQIFIYAAIALAGSMPAS